MKGHQTESVPVVTIDGPSGTGKGTIARIVADRLGWNLLDSGALYRLLALAAQTRSIALDNVSELVKLAPGLDVQFMPTKNGETEIFLDGEEVSPSIRTEEAGNNASKVAALGEVRAALVDRQHAFRVRPGLVADGRDMGTVIFPDACLKIYLTASAEERAKRRHKQLKEKGLNVNLLDLSREISERDDRDASRKVAPLKPATDAEIIDTSDIGVDEVVDRVNILLEKYT